MWLGLLIAGLLLLAGSPAAPDTHQDTPKDTPRVFRGIARDGTVQFADRPSRVPQVQSRQQLGAFPEAMAVRPINVAKAQPLPGAEADSLGPPTEQSGHQSAHRASQNPSPPGVAGSASADRCEALRQRSEELWRQRRRGYLADRETELKQAIRQHQQEMKRLCGQWR